jgi:mannose/cellobiose epimerase-like protein (N-acyl-D-glucosamine 2-epimerase family)
VTVEDAAWLAGERRRLLEFARAARHPSGGFGWLDERGRLVPDRPVATWITARMTHVFSLARGLGEPDAAELAAHGVAALRGPLRDPVHGGWRTSADDDRKACYEHAFVVLAAASATAAGVSGAAELLAEALGVVERRFWDEAAGLARESWDRAWLSTEDYRGANSNMHLVEAFLAAGDVTGDARWHTRASRIAERLIHGVAAAHDWRLPEHFTADWEPRPDYHRDQPAHPFRPFGGTPGHWLEWSRLLLHLDATLGAAAPPWLVPDARALFDSAVTRAWGADGQAGFVYTLDWRDRPVVRSRMHWVIAEAILAAHALHARTGEPGYLRWYREFWGFARARHLDLAGGSWHHELDPAGQPAASVWPGKPDVYHAFQAALLPVLPLAPAAAVTCACPV